MAIQTTVLPSIINAIKKIHQILQSEHFVQMAVPPIMRTYIHKGFRFWLPFELVILFLLPKRLFAGTKSGDSLSSLLGIFLVHVLDSIVGVSAICL